LIWAIITNCLTMRGLRRRRRLREVKMKRNALVALFAFAAVAAGFGAALSVRPEGPGGAKEPVPAKKIQVAVFQTRYGKIMIRFFPSQAPSTVRQIKHLVKIGFYNGTKFHRIIPGYIIQGGDPNTKKSDRRLWGEGDYVGPDGKPVYLKAEFNSIHHGRGVVSMARAQDPNSASCQFFICVGDAGQLDHRYTAFGKVIEGMGVVDKIANAPRVSGTDEPVNPVAIEKAWLTYYRLKAVSKSK
jgi:peptidyl-prolyl cis-trans isomerase B (cyclophilin B)